MAANRKFQKFDHEVPERVRVHMVTCFRLAYLELSVSD